MILADLGGEPMAEDTYGARWIAVHEIRDELAALIRSQLDAARGTDSDDGTT